MFGVVSHDSVREVEYLDRNLVMPHLDHEDGKSPHLRRASDLSMGSRNPVLMAYIKYVFGPRGTSVHVASCQLPQLPKYYLTGTMFARSAAIHTG